VTGSAVLRVALTGGIATGKSYCLRQFERLGAAGIDADLLSRQVVEKDTPGLQAIVARFGSAVLLNDGTLDRPTLGHIVFSDARARADLEAIIHPEVYRHIREWFANLSSGIAVGIADIPLVFETGHHHDFDRTAVAACEPQEQIRRMIERNQLSEAEARARLAAQWPIAEKITRANYVIWTDRGFAETDRQVKDVYERLLADAG
jgi:dephospho-CoA kinase